MSALPLAAPAAATSVASWPTAQDEVRAAQTYGMCVRATAGFVHDRALIVLEGDDEAYAVVTWKSLPDTREVEVWIELNDGMVDRLVMPTDKPILFVGRRTCDFILRQGA